MLEKVESFLNKYSLTNPKYTYLVGFSGGADSLTLIDLLNKICKNYEIKLVAMHVNHNWRADEAFKEMQNCENYCKANDIEFLSVTLNDNLKKSELVARDARLKIFKQCANKFTNPILFTGHTATDNAETLIYRMAKGTGIEGLKGILPCQNLLGMTFFRPLLAFSREDNINYCLSNNLEFNVDSSNDNTKYKRNYIRHEIVPKLKNINNKIETSLNRLSILAQNESAIVQEYIEILAKKVVSNDRFLTNKFLELSCEIQRKMIYNCFLEKNLDYDFLKIENVLNFIKDFSSSKSGSRMSVTKDLWIFVNNCEFYFIDKLRSENFNFEIQIKKNGEYAIGDWIFSIQPFTQKIKSFPSEKELIAYVDLNFYKNMNFVIRTRKDGDIINPLGMSGYMKLKKYLNAKKISQHNKDSILLFCDNDEVLWVSAIGLSDKIKVEQNPTHVLKLYKINS